MSISTKIQLFTKAVTDRWHTPGHKGMLWQDDISEMGGGDIFPGSELEKAQDLAAKVFGAKAVRFLTGGSSMGVKAAILTCGGDIIASHFSHRSVKEGANLAKVNLFTIKNDIENGLPAPLKVAQVEAAMREYPEAKAVVIESPDYYGRICAPGVAECVKNAGKILIADSAHGAHFPFRPDIFPFSYSSVADFCNMSAHKTLFSFTMGAYLCINNEQLLERADEALANLGTTSPLYPLLASLENALYTGLMQKEIYDGLKESCEHFRSKIKCLKTDDFSRLTVDAKAYGLGGKELYGALYQKGIAAEMFNERYVVFVATAADDREKFIRLEEAILKEAE